MEFTTKSNYNTENTLNIVDQYNTITTKQNYQ